jgi:IclR family acetate operon transcriptional repressor
LTDNEDGAATKVTGVQVLERAFKILSIIGAAEGDISLSQLAVASGLPTATIHRIARSMVSTGYVLQLPSRRYALGPRLIGLGESASRMLGSWARPPMTRLVEAVGETANLATLDGDGVVFLAQVRSQHAMQMLNEPGGRVFAHCSGIGKALLAQLSPDTALALVERTGMPAMTPATITNSTLFAVELDRVRAQGYAIDDGERETGVRCIAVPVPVSSFMTAVSISGPEGRVTMDAVDRIVPILKQSANEIAKAFDLHTTP